MGRKCPFCGDYTVDYDPILKMWKCLWVTCPYERKAGKDEVNPLLQAILGENENKEIEKSRLSLMTLHRDR